MGDALLERVTAATDRSSGSADLVRGCADPTLRRELDGSAAAVLRPFTLRPGLRVLEVGPGTGTRTRALLDAGVEVTALVADADAAGVLAARAAGVTGLTLAVTEPEAWLRSRPSGSADFDLVLVAVGPTDPGPLVASLRSTVAPGGALAILATNPWAGLGRVPAGATWSIRTVEEALRVSGLSAVRRFLVGPTLDRAAAIVAETALLDPGSRAALAAIGPAVGGEAGALLGSVTDAASARLALDLGDAFLLVAAEGAGAFAERIGTAAAWLDPDPGAIAGWSRPLVVDLGASGVRIRPLTERGTIEAGPLRLEVRAGDVVEGRNAGRLLADALLREGLEGPETASLLRAWWSAVAPLLADTGGRRALDARPSRFIVDAQGAWHALPSGATVDPAIPAGVIALGGLLDLVEALVLPVGVPRGVAPSATPQDVAAACLAIAGVEPDPDAATIWLELRTERHVRAHPSPEPRAVVRRRLRRAMDGCFAEQLAGRPLAVLASLAERTVAAEAEVAALRAALADAHAAPRLVPVTAAAAVSPDAPAGVPPVEPVATPPVAMAAEAPRAVAPPAAMPARPPAPVEIALLAPPDPASRPTPDAAPAPTFAPTPKPSAPRVSADPPPSASPARGPGLTLRLRSRLAENADRAQLGACGLFDAAWYSAVYPDVAHTGLAADLHFLRHGGWEGRDPGPGFSTRAYLAAYPDVAASGRIPLLHYLHAGRQEGRRIVPSTIRRP